ncbi:hypothetical protein [Pseudomonas sp. Irchel 3A7]|uniref:hypothetical protein n=1 Tax=Pseudomonas sp. Irchel 3A7 TaxID=2008913 RepID=UPI000BA2C1A7|nr:hypothetical protein [Pseudomonas sp. Irchel 3A7]
MKLYENITIGNFLFALGYLIRDKQPRRHLAGSINLLQQTPADELLGDVLLKFTGVVRLIEFKAEGADLTKERGKHAALKVALEELGLVGVSKDIHWFVETKATDHTLGLRTLPYLDAFPRPRGPKLQRLDGFIDTLAQDIAEQRVTYTGDQIKQYMAWVRHINAGGGEVGSGGLLLVAEPGGLVRFAPLEDMLELNMHDRHWIKERMLQMERETEFRMKREQEKELKRQKSQTKGHRIG